MSALRLSHEAFPGRARNDIEPALLRREHANLFAVVATLGGA
jgi:hypothetical protein